MTRTEERIREATEAIKNCKIIIQSQEMSCENSPGLTLARIRLGEWKHELWRLENA